MKYIRYMASNKEHVGIIKDDIIYDLDYSCIIDAIAHEDEIDINESTTTHRLEEVDVLPPTNPSKIVCVGLNYKDHAEELNMELPDEPLLFMKPSTSVISTNSAIIYPSTTNMLDFEGELGIVILEKVSPCDNGTCNVAYTIVNDVTARDLQSKDGQWTRSKSYDTFCPCGPVVVTGIDSSNLNIKTMVNNDIKQESNTKNMIFSPLELVKYISNIMTLNPGDIIASGTPHGVGHLDVGDTVVVEIDEMGSLVNIVK